MARRCNGYGRALDRGERYFRWPNPLSLLTGPRPRCHICGFSAYRSVYQTLHVLGDGRRCSSGDHRDQGGSALPDLSFQGSRILRQSSWRLFSRRCTTLPSKSCSKRIPSGDASHGWSFEDLISIVERFDGGFQSLSRRKRVRTAFKAALHSKHIQRFRDSLNDTKSTLTLAMAHERYFGIQCIRKPDC